MSDLSHLRLEGTAASVPYTYAGGGGGGPFRLPPRDRLPHAERLKADLEQAQNNARVMRQLQGLPEEGQGDVLSIRSEDGFELKIDSLERRQSGIELLSVKAEDGVMVAKVFVPSGKLIQLLGLIDAYQKKVSQRSGQPRNRELVESIASIRLAAVKDLWRTYCHSLSRMRTSGGKYGCERVLQNSRRRHTAVLLTSPESGACSSANSSWRFRNVSSLWRLAGRSNSVARWTCLSSSRSSGRQRNWLPTTARSRRANRGRSSTSWSAASSHRTTTRRPFAFSIQA